MIATNQPTQRPAPAQAAQRCHARARPNGFRQRLAALTAGLLLASGSLLLPGGPVRAATDEISAAERALFMEPSLGSLKPQVLAYSFRRSGTLDEPFTDDVKLTLVAREGGTCCNAKVDFLTGARAVKLPDIDLPEANPVLLGFLEHDIREMERATGGKANYFRKRIRMALADGPSLTPRTLSWRGKDVPGIEISIKPYADDPMRQRYDKLADKRYVFWRSAQVPGRLYGIRTEVPGAAASGTVLASTELWLAGAKPVQP